MTELFQLRNPRENCWQIVLEFGPHSFTLLDYATRKTAESALASIKANWKLAGHYL